MEIQKVPAASAVEGTQLVGVALNDAAAHGGVKSELHQVGANWYKKTVHKQIRPLIRSTLLRKNDKAKGLNEQRDY